MNLDASAFGKKNKVFSESTVCTIISWFITFSDFFSGGIPCIPKSVMTNRTLTPPLHCRGGAVAPLSAYPGIEPGSDAWGMRLIHKLYFALHVKYTYINWASWAGLRSSLNVLQVHDWYWYTYIYIYICTHTHCVHVCVWLYIWFIGIEKRIEMKSIDFEIGPYYMYIHT